ncbi:hypothetical protein [Mesorhizobium retamae]|uniref:Uncharacterized protein n=1 Tax=Mesorhizobium retamae TaxID=2912854 RepID=A0ABS9QBH9_9HYPH|nr:hypothetical protein [Mesorhizobium sp. IRAMC:0171]MCG7504765.1 hypothetical protein [Mesorhizobium sp. IRAMC:0171]
MSVSFNVLDKNILSKPIEKMSKAERELLKLRTQQVAEAITGSGMDSTLVAYQILEARGAIPKGSVQNLLDSIKAEDERPSSGKSPFAEQRGSQSRGSLGGRGWE